MFSARLNEAEAVSQASRLQVLTCPVVRVARRAGVEFSFAHRPTRARNYHAQQKFSEHWPRGHFDGRLKTMTPPWKPCSASTGKGAARETSTAEFSVDWREFLLIRGLFFEWSMCRRMSLPVRLIA